MKLKDILKRLEEFESNEERLEYLKELLEELDDEDLIKYVQQLIDGLEESLETKLENIEISRGRRRDLEDTETDLEVQERLVARSKTVVRPDLTLPRIEDEGEVRYGESTLNYKPISTIPVYQAVQPFSTYENISLQNQLNTKIIEEILIKEKDFNVGQVISDVQREEIRDTIEKFIPNASVEEKIRAEQQIMYDMKFRGKDLKYVTKLK